jgi:hypothetical protein
VSVQICEGIWRNRSGQRLVITQCKPDDDGQRWTDGDQRYSDNGSFYGRYGGCSEQDLVEYIGPFPYSSQRAPVSRPAETESTTAVAGGVSEDPGRIIYELEERLRVANNTIVSQAAEIEQLQTERQAEYAARLEGLLDNSRDALRDLQDDHTAMGHHCEGMKSAFLAVIKTLTGVRS